MATPRGFIELASGPSGIVTGFASIPTGADNAIIRVEAGTYRWSETSGSWLNASTGLLSSAADPPVRLGNLSQFRFCPVGGGAAVGALYYQGFEFI